MRILCALARQGKCFCGIAEYDLSLLRLHMRSAPLPLLDLSLQPPRARVCKDCRRPELL